MLEHWYYFGAVVAGSEKTGRQYIRVRAEHIGEALQHVHQEGIYLEVQWVLPAEVPLRDDGEMALAIEYTLGEEDEKKEWCALARNAHLS